MTSRKSRALTQIFSDNETDAMASQLQTLPWEMSPHREEVRLDLNNLTPAQEHGILIPCYNNPAINISYSEYSGALDRYETIIMLKPPQSRSPVLQKIWDGILPQAEKRLHDRMEMLANLPWQYSQTSEPRYYISQKDAAEDHKKILEALPEGFVKKERFSFLYGGGPSFEVETQTQGYIQHRFYTFLNEKIQSGLESDARAIASFPWMLDPAGAFVLKKNTIAADNGTGGDALIRRGVISHQDAFILAHGNTTEKLYETPDGETDRCRMLARDYATQTVMARVKDGYAKLAELPWEYDSTMRAFMVTSEQARPILNTVPDLKGEHRIDGYFYLKALPVPGRGAPDEYRAVLQNFKTALSHKFEDFDMNGAQTWPWQQDRFGGEDFCLTKKALKTLLARTPVSHLPLEKNYEGDFYIAAEPLANVPYVASIHKAQRQIQAKYLQDHEAEVRALPWMPGIADSLDDFGALRLYRADLNNGQLALALDMESRGCLRDHIKEYWNPAGIPMRQFLETEFEARVKHMIEIIAHCPWQHSRDGIVFIPDTANLLNEQADILSRLYLTDKFDAHVEREGGRQGSGWKARNTLRTRIAEVMCENAVVTKIPGDVLALPWEFDDDDIILRDRNVRPEQFMRAQQALPWCKPGSDTDFDDFSMEKHRKFQIASPEAYDVGRRFLEAPYYQQLMPAALRSLTKTMQEVVKMPWGKSGEIYERALSPEQQKILNKTPRQIVNWRCRSIHSNERIYTLAVPAGAKPQLAAPLAPVMQHP